MSALVEMSDVLSRAVQTAGLEEAFDGGDTAFEDCPACGHLRGLKMSLRTGRAQCLSCGIDGALLTYLRERSEGQNWRDDDCTDAEIIVLEPRLPRITGPQAEAPKIRIVPVGEADPVPEPVADPVTGPARQTGRDGKLGERIIMTLLALIFLGAGLAAAGLSGFANFQAFSASVSDPVQARIWGWSGVIASVCSFGGFTFFWWHTSSRRLKEGLRALAFALAGAATSIAGTAMFMTNNDIQQQAQITQAERARAVIEAQVSDWNRQLQGIPADTRSVAGLEAYIAGVEAAGRTHQKPYRDAQNELGLALRRTELERKVAGARAQLLGAGQARTIAGPVISAEPARQALPSWFFALMLEVFSSQGTSIAFVSLLLLYGQRTPISPEPQPGWGS